MNTQSLTSFEEAALHGFQSETRGKPHFAVDERVTLGSLCCKFPYLQRETSTTHRAESGMYNCSVGCSVLFCSKVHWYIMRWCWGKIVLLELACIP